MTVANDANSRRAALVTGASSGIGLAIAHTLGRLGYQMTIAARRPDKLARAAEELREAGYEVLHVAGDLGTEAAVTDLIAAHREAYARLDVLVNNAGVCLRSPVDEIETDNLDYELATNFRSVVMLCRGCMPMIRAAAAEHGSAHIINTASLGATRGEPWRAVYSASKFAVLGWTQSMHREVSEHGIKCTALCPGFVDTPMVEFAKGDVPSEEMIQPEDLGLAVELILRLSPACIVPEIRMIRPGQQI
jgi:NAD(P)-dependent dehydrogenase (short-subunit alcohol dehydrogenase family)